MSRKNEIIADAGIYTSLSIIAQLITLVAGILTRKFLGPTQTGIWALLQIILIYASYTTLGVTESLLREIPFHRGKGEEERAKEIKDVAYSFFMVTAVLISAGCILYAFLFRRQLAPEVFYGLFFVAALNILQRYNNLQIALLRGYKYFSLASIQVALSAIVNAVLVAVFSLKFKVYGFMFAMCLSFVFNILFIRVYHNFKFQWKFDLKKIGDLIAYGFPLIIVSLLGTFFLTIDKLLIAKILGVKEVGIYSLAILAFTYLGSIPNSIGTVLIPNFHQKMGETNDPASLTNYLDTSAQALNVLIPLVIGSVWFLAPYLTSLVLPEFHESITAMKCLITGVFFLALNHPYSYFLVVIRKQTQLLIVTAITCVLAFISNYCSLKWGYGIVGVAAATVFVFFIKFSATYLLACKQLHSKTKLFQEYFKFVGKFLAMVFLSMLLNHFFENEEPTLANSSFQYFVFCLFYLPPLIKLNRKLKLFDVLKAKLMKQPTIPVSQLEVS